MPKVRLTFKCNVQLCSVTDVYDFQGEDGPWEFKNCESGDVINESEPIQVRFDYPMDNPLVATLTIPGKGSVWHVEDFVVAVANKYRDIYKEEEATTKVPAGLAGGGLINRSRTNGVHGIYAHDLEDLWLEAFYKGKDGVWVLEIGS